MSNGPIRLRSARPGDSVRLHLLEIRLTLTNVGPDDALDMEVRMEIPDHLFSPSANSLLLMGDFPAGQSTDTEVHVFASVEEDFYGKDGPITFRATSRGPEASPTDNVYVTPTIRNVGPDNPDSTSCLASIVPLETGHGPLNGLQMLLLAAWAYWRLRRRRLA